MERVVDASTRFESKVERDNVTGCLVWKGGTNEHGYGTFHVGVVDGRKVRMLAHRWAYLQWVGPIPDGMEVRHIECRNPPCVEPSHLGVGTHADNMQDRLADGTNPWASRSKCGRGHDYDAENTSFNKKGHRVCRKCVSINNKNNYLKQKARN